MVCWAEFGHANLALALASVAAVLFAMRRKRLQNPAVLAGIGSVLVFIRLIVVVVILVC